GGAVDVRPDTVALHLVAAGPGVEEVDAEAVVAGDDIARGGSPAADGVVRRPSVDADAGAVAPWPRAGGVGADEVARDDVPGGATEAHLHAAAGVGADDVPLRGVIDSVRVGADDVVGRVDDEDAVSGVARGRTVGQEADEVALDDVARAGE